MFYLNKIEYGGLGLDFKYLAALLEELGTIKCGGVGMALAVQVSMTQQALSRLTINQTYIIMSFRFFCMDGVK
jgi:hypothetical protein